MLVELSVVEPRYHAVMEVAAGAPVVEVAARYGVSRNDATSRMLGGYAPNCVHCPSETTVTESSTTLMAVCSSMA